MSYEEFGLRFNPFNKEKCKCRDRFETRDIRCALSCLQYLKEARGLGVITARPGMGKTFAVHCFSETLDPSTNPMIYINHSTVGVRDFYREISLNLGLSASGTKPKLLKDIQEHILYMHKEQNRSLILAIDEAHHLNSIILNDLKILMNQEYDSLNAFTLLLIGEPDLNKTLSRPSNEALYQRITAHYSFTGLRDEEFRDYVAHKFKVAGGNISIVDTAAMNALQKAAGGNPRMVDILMTGALRYGIQLNETRITERMIKYAESSRKLG